MKRRTLSTFMIVGTFLFSVMFMACSNTRVRNDEATRDREINKAPNLLYVFPDQMRMQAMGFWKDPAFRKLLLTDTDPVYTPNIDNLAKRSVVFTQATSTHPVCSPHWAMLMSGMYPSRNGVEDLNCKAGRTQGLHDSIECFTDVLAKAGYETAYIGKTHWERTEPLFDEDFNYVGTTEAPGGHYANTFDTYIPEGSGRHGNKFWAQFFVDNHFKGLAYSNRPELVNGNADGVPVMTNSFVPGVEVDAVIQFLRNKNKERNPDKPFSLFWAPNPPHNPYFTPEDCEKDIYEKYYRDMPLSEQLYRKNVVDRLPSEPEKYDAKKCAAIYYSLVTGIDRQLGRIVKALEETGEADNTIIVFTSDHGEMLGSHGVMGKNRMEDESFLVPFLICYPEKIKPHTDDLLLSSVDIMPSILGLMGLADLIPQTAEGIDYSQGIATGNYTNCPKPLSALYLNMSRKGVRTNRYSYVVHDNGKAEVTDNITDPYQIHKLSPDVIPPTDLEMLKKELGMRLKLAGDKWAIEKRFADLITY